MKIVRQLLCLAFLGATLHASAAGMTLRSPAFRSGGMIPLKFTCHGADQNPPLEFKGVPPGAKSLALVVEDPDAPGGLFTHWLAWNIDPRISEVKSASVPTGTVQGQNDFGTSGYRGPCPPSGVHRYVFRVLALNQKLELRAGAKRAVFDRAIAGHVLAQGELMARFGR